MSYVLQASLSVKCCLLILLWLSIRSWATGIDLYVTLRRIRSKCQGLTDTDRTRCPHKLSIATHGYQRQLSSLSLVARISPYIGLVGTVMGVMSAISALSSHSTLTLALVGPGLSEALITTAIGLCVAIPATVWHQINDSLLVECEDYLATRAAQ